MNCQYRDGDDDVAPCTASGNDVHRDLCGRCLEASGGRPDPTKPNRWLASAMFEAYLTGRSKDLQAFRVAEAVVYEISGGCPPEAQISPQSDPGLGVARCSFLGRAVTRSGCGCWRKGKYECKAQGGKHVVPEIDCSEVDCPVAKYDPE